MTLLPGFSDREMTVAPDDEERARLAHLIWETSAPSCKRLRRTRLGTPLTSGGEFHDVLSGMGQELFNPPNVKSWRKGKAWLNTLTQTARLTFVSQLVDTMNAHGKLPARVRHALDTNGTDADTPTTPEKMVDAIWQLMLPGHTPSEKTRAALVTYTGAVDPPAEATEDGKPPEKKPLNFDARVPGLLTLILVAPDYQVG